MTDITLASMLGVAAATCGAGIGWIGCAMFSRASYLDGVEHARWLNDCIENDRKVIESLMQDLAKYHAAEAKRHRDLQAWQKKSVEARKRNRAVKAALAKIGGR